jgi:hypothetical protein
MRKKQINNFRLFESLNYGTNQEEIFTWISCDEQLPNENEFVLGREIRANGGPGYEIVRLIKTEHTSSTNNSKDYEWKTFGPKQFFGQEITHWMPLPALPDGGWINR